MMINKHAEALLEGSTHLIDEIKEAVRNQDWANVHRLSGELLVLEGSASLDGSIPSFATTFTSGSDIENDINNSERSRSSLSSRSSYSGFYDRLTVLQAAPLVTHFCQKTSCWKPLPPINFRWEKEELIKALSDVRAEGTTIDVDFDVATPGRLNAFLANDKRSLILHISCHGMFGGALVFEDGVGYATFMTVDDLMQYHSLSSLTAVFVSACHSRSIGEAFIAAGVKHVICCTNEAKLKDSAAIKFTSAFYRALAYGRTLKDAFELAKHHVMHEPSIDESHVEVDKFILLPERDDDFHNVPIFFQRSSVRPPVVETTPRRVLIPSLPDHFMDRNIEALKIIHFLRGCDVVKLVGPEGIGKTSLATFVATYVSERHHVSEGLSFSNVLCFLNEEIDSFEHVRQEIDKLVDKDKRTLLVLDAGKYAHLGKASITEEVLKILKLPTTVKMLIISEQEGAVEFPTNIVVKKVELKPFTYHATVTLFATLCPHVKEYADAMVHSVQDFANLVFRRKLFMDEHEVKDYMPKRAAELFEKLGAGYPKEIVHIAKNLSLGDYKVIMKLAKKFDTILEPFDTRYELECAMLKAKLDRYQALNDGLIHKAQTEWDIWLELERLLDSKPSVEKLGQERDQVVANLNETQVAYDVAYFSDSSAKTALFKAKKDLTAKVKYLNLRIENEENAKKDLSEKAKHLNFQIELEKRALRISNRASSLVYGDQSDAVPDDDEAEKIPPVAKIFAENHSVTPPCPIPEITATRLLTYRIKATHPFVLQINQGPAQSFSYPSSDKAGIVVASNEACIDGQGILNAVTHAGGPALRQEVYELPGALHSEFGRIRCLAGDAKIVGPGSFGTLGVPYVMFAVGPWFTSENEEHRRLFLTGAYRSALNLAKEYKLEAVAFSLIGSSCRGGESWKETVAIGLNTIIHSKGYPELKEIHLYGFTADEATELTERSMEANAKFPHMKQIERS